MPSSWVQQYLAFLGLSAEPPSLDALARLMRQQVLRVPFENASALLHYQAAQGQVTTLPDPAGRLELWTRQAGGGVCFEIAGLFHRLLVELSYDASLITAHIIAPHGHQAIVVTLNGRRYLVDVGNGGPFFDSIPVDETTEVHFGALGHRFRPAEAPHLFHQERLNDGAWKRFCDYTLSPATPEAVQACLRLHFTPSLRSWVIGQPVMVRCTEDAVYAVRDNRLTTYGRDGSKHTQPLEDLDALERVAREVMGLPALPLRAALDVRAELDRQQESLSTSSS